MAETVSEEEMVLGSVVVKVLTTLWVAEVVVDSVLRMVLVLEAVFADIELLRVCDAVVGRDCDTDLEGETLSVAVRVEVAEAPD